MRIIYFFTVLFFVIIFIMAPDQSIGSCLIKEKNKMNESSSVDIDLNEEWRGDQSGTEQPLFIVAKNISSWHQIWEYASQEPPRPLEPAREMAVGIFLGLKPTGGYDVELISAREENEVFMVRYREKQPDPDQVVIQVLTSPYLIKVFPATDLKVVSQKIEQD